MSHVTFLDFFWKILFSNFDTEIPKSNSSNITDDWLDFTSY